MAVAMGPDPNTFPNFKFVWLAQNKMHINDWSAIQTLFDKLNKQLEKSMKVRGQVFAAHTARP